ncbi:MAG: hypothetical protein E7643_05390 [Ruminococcaceae bacterium]|nr:hypothetical protein [Oscillospiraceae bacterium]
MTLIKVCMLAVAGIAATAIIKQWKSDFLPLVRLGILLLLGTVLLTLSSPLFSYVRALTQYSGSTAHAELLFKALGIALLAQISADVCRECGESSLATGVELTGKIEILLLCLPMIGELLKIAEELLSIGGAS